MRLGSSVSINGESHGFQTVADSQLAPTGSVQILGWQWPKTNRDMQAHPPGQELMPGWSVAPFLGRALFDSSLPVSLAAHQVLYIRSLLPAAGIARAQIPSSTQSAETME